MNQITPAPLSADRTVLVVGGGIGGLAAATAIRRTGVAVTLVERADAFGEVGAGLQLGPNATRILRRWGLLDEVIAVGVTPQNLVVLDAVTGEELTRQELTGEFAERYGAPYVVAHRTDLHAIILKAARDSGVDLVTGTTIIDVRSDGFGARATAEDGTIYEADIVIAADGLNSRLRTTLSDDQPVPSGYVAYRGAIPIDQVPNADKLEDVIVWVGPGCHLVRYLLRNGSMLNQVAVFHSPGYERGEVPWGGVSELDDAYAACVPEIREGVQHLDRTRNWPMYDREPIDTWVDGRMVLLGDAAHPMLQYLAQGACQAIEDAEAIADALVAAAFTEAADGWQHAFASYQAVRTARTARIQKNARLWGKSWHVEGFARVLRNELFRNRANDDFDYIDWIYQDKAAGEATGTGASVRSASVDGADQVATLA
ncbi:FAD-dependent monooxygenase [Glaciibacter sp. 2TAF33]|uniref:FAD-dependent monooxygenase n=1 Tax=Glaciibacter sp. 2TAF33 TaxID=3233015 RepID=UPI003F90160B